MDQESEQVVDQNFVKWLDAVTLKFASLSDVEKNATLDHLIAASGPAQLRYLHDSIDNLVRRDFLRLLPPELKEVLLSFLDFKTLLAACCVSKTWNAIIDSSSRTWQRACVGLGIQIDPGDLQNASPCYWKSFFFKMARRRSDMKTCKAFEAKTYGRHLRRITAVYYRHGRLATASDNRTLHLWDCGTDECLFTLRTDASVTDVKFDDRSLIVSSYLGHLVRWDAKSRERLLEYHRHVGAIFSFDYSDSLDLLVSGSADTTLKVWSLSRGSLLTTLHEHSAWVLKVLLQPVAPHDDREPPDLHVLLTMDKGNILVWKLCRKRYSSDEGLYVASLYGIPLDGKDVDYFTPGLHFDGRYVYFMKQDFDLASDSVLCKWDLWEQKMVSKTGLRVRVKALLGVGRRYAAVLTCRKSLDSPNFLVFNLATLERVVAWNLPPSRPSTPLCAQMTLGACDWLNGLNDKNDSGLLLAAGVDCSTVYVLKWLKRT